MCRTVLHLAHAMLHPGIKRTNIILQSRVWWPTMTTDIYCYIADSNICKCKKRTPENNAPLGRTMSEKNLPKLGYWSCDILSFPVSSSRYKSLRTMMDYRTQWLEANKLSDETDTSIINVLPWEFTPWYAYGCTLCTDQRKSFMTHQLQPTCEALNYTHTTTLTYNPKANQVEREHRELNNRLWILLQD